MGRLLQALGLLLMAAGLFGLGLLGGREGLALAFPCATPAPAATADPAAAPHDPSAVTVQPAAAASPLPPCPSRPHRSFLGSGPITFSGTGGLLVGRNSAGSSAGYSIAQNETGISMLLEAARRTAQTSLVIDQGIGGTNSAYDLGQVNIGYSTPLYTLGYGQVNGPNDTQLSSGAYNRGFMFTVPRGRGEYDFIAARTTGNNGYGGTESFSVAGFRHSGSYGRGILFSQSVYLARGDHGGGTDSTFDLALGSYKAGNTIRGEVAYSQTRGMTGVVDGGHLASALHVDLMGAQSAESIAFTSIPDYFASLGQVQNGQRTIVATLRRNIGRGGILTVQTNSFNTDVFGQTQLTQQENAAFSYPLFKRTGSVQLQQSIERVSAQGTTYLQHLLGATLNEQLLQTALSESYSVTTNNSGFAALATPAPGTTPLPLTNQSGMQHEYAFSLSRPLAGGYVTLSTDTNRSYQQGAQSSVVTSTYSYSHPIGLKAIGQLSFATVAVKGVDPVLGIASSTQRQIQATLTRRISPVLSLQVMGGRTIQTGVGGGTSHYLDFSIVGPLAFGGASRYVGRPNPNLPAIVTGHVYYVEPASSYGLVGNRGIPNVVVTLDTGQTQRTDATGAYEFQFVRPGQHTVTIGDATLPAGVVPDSTTQTINVQGGQMVTLDFAAGAFAGVEGTVVAQSSTGTAAVPGVQLTIDGRIQGATGPNGQYLIGHLLPGKHIVKVETDSLPATVQLEGADTQEIDVSQGQITTLNWKLVGLGSIQGSVLAPSSGGYGPLVGVRNVYAVAHPGEHAAITDDDGHFIIDNLPSGQYTLTVDQDSLPDGMGVVQAPIGPVTVSANHAVTEQNFTLGPVQKKVVFTFIGGAAGSSIIASFTPEKAPPDAMVELSVSGVGKATAVVASGPLGKAVLRYDKSAAAWTGRLRVPSLKNDAYTERVDVAGGKGSASAVLTVDARVPLVIVRTQPSRPRPGAQIRVLLHVLADVEAGDTIYFEDGTKVTLGEPSGRNFVFDVRVGPRLPYHGLIITRKGERIPFQIDP
jgi:hypothetical protein